LSLLVAGPEWYRYSYNIKDWLINCVGFNINILVATGYVRGQNLSVNRLVHIPGVGDFQLERVEKLQDPAPIARKQVRGWHRTYKHRYGQ
jgi:hypothetical protein